MALSDRSSEGCRELLGLQIHSEVLEVDHVVESSEEDELVLRRPRLPAVHAVPVREAQNEALLDLSGKEDSEVDRNF